MKYVRDDDKTYSEAVNETIDEMLGVMASIKEEIITQLIEALNQSGYDVTKREPKLENELSSVIWKSKELKVKAKEYPPILLELTFSEGSDVETEAVISSTELTEFAHHWLVMFGAYNVTKLDPEILPCPFCGHDDLSEYDFVYVDDEVSEMAIECRGCGLRGTPRNSLTAAIEAWNDLPRNQEKEE